jgi:putative hydrolase of the HAD superfamily
MIKTVIFDLGGVLVRTENRLPRQQLAERYGMTYQEIDQLVYGSSSARQATVGAISAQEHKSAVMEKLGLSGEHFESIFDEFWRGDRLDSKLVEFIKGLQGEYKTALLSNAWDDLRQLLVNLWKIDGIFDEIFISAEINLAKPDPAIYQYVIRALGDDPASMVFIDDFIENIVSAREQGINAIHFRSLEQALSELAEYLDTDLSPV